MNWCYQDVFQCFVIGWRLFRSCWGEAIEPNRVSLNGDV
jgi:hypothetical protein